MNAIQFYYISNVLGVSSIIQPEKLRSVYRLHPSLEKQTDFLLFCRQLKTEEEKQLIQKIKKSPGALRKSYRGDINRSL